MPSAVPTILDLGQLPYEAAYDEQVRRVDEVLAAREAGSPIPGYLLLVEHDPVITVSRRAGAEAHLLASPERLIREGVHVAQTDRGGDITYHGPGQIVAYPILDLNYFGLGLHAYMRLLEEAVIRSCAAFGLACGRDPKATGVWVDVTEGEPPRKICAMGVRLRKWVSMHGLALNVATNLDHFGLIVPCGLVGRGVTSLARELGDAAPSISLVRTRLAAAMNELLSERLAARGETPATDPAR